MPAVRQPDRATASRQLRACSTYMGATASWALIENEVVKGFLGAPFSLYHTLGGALARKRGRGEGSGVRGMDWPAGFAPSCPAFQPATIQPSPLSLLLSLFLCYAIVSVSDQLIFHQLITRIG
jgi:hypothetical protein